MKKSLLYVSFWFLSFCSASGPLAAFPFDEAIQAADAAEGAGRWLDVRNELTRVLEWDRLSPTLSCERRTRLQLRRDEAVRRWLASLPAPATPPPLEKKVRRSARPAFSVDRQDDVDVHEIVVRAEAARKAGRLETALRLFRAAARLPGGKEAAKDAAEIETEVGDQAER